MPRLGWGATGWLCSNLRCIQIISGGPSWEWFFLVTVLVELDLAKGVKHAVGALLAVEQARSDEVILELAALTDVLRQLRQTFGRMHEKLPAESFYNVVRPFLNGWTGPKFNGGIIYEGVHTEPLIYSGGSAAQSTGLQCFDVALGISHDGDAGDFLRRMRSYMPPAHRELVEDLQGYESVHAYAERRLDDEALVTAYNSCLAALYDLRSYHLQIVAKYVIVQSNRHTNLYGGIKDKGTGGQSLMPFLKTIRAGATRARLEGDASPDSSSSSAV